MQESRKSLLFRLGIIVLLVVLTVILLEVITSYHQARSTFISEMEMRTEHSLVALEKNLTPLISSYAVHEYEKLIHTEVERSRSFAIVVDDYNMAKIVGEASYKIGKLLNSDGGVTDYDLASEQQNRILDECCYINQRKIRDSSGFLLGEVFIYVSYAELEKELNTIVKNNLAEGGAIALLLILFLFFFMRKFIVSPLSDVVEAIENTDEDGIPAGYVPSVNVKEINQLSNAVNNMIVAVRGSRQELKEQKVLIAYQAHHDSLTGLGNRLFFYDRLEHAIYISERNKNKLALFFIDLDNFKKINDSLGHDVGDKLLKLVSERLEDTLRSSDTLARLGGDEFTILIEDVTEIGYATVIAENILESLSKPFVIAGQKLFVTISIGISIFPDDGKSSIELLKFSDAAMYKAKSEGKNNFQFYSRELTEQAMERVQLESSLRTAISNEEFEVFYQPQVDGRDGQFIGMEALVRWHSPARGVVSPGKFIPLAELTGLIVDLDRLVMRQAMTQLSMWYQMGLNPGILALNLSMKQLQQDDFLHVLGDLVDETACKNEWLELEVTESQVMSHPEKAIKLLHSISEMGIGIAIDDFGTGYSSLAYLKRLPIDKLKIDREFVKDLPGDKEGKAIAIAVIALAHSLDLSVLAEGVETEEQRAFFVENGCNKIQGFFYGKPMSSKAMTKFLHESQAVLN